MKLIVDGKPYVRPTSKAVQNITDYLDALPYGKAVTKNTLAKQFNYKDPRCIQMAFRHVKADFIESYRYKLSHQITLWANPKTIRDLKNGKFKL